MIYKASKLDNNELVKTITESDLHAILLESDAPNSFDEMIKKGISHCDKLSIYGDGKLIYYLVFPIYYNKKEVFFPDILQSRANAYRNLFLRWTDEGYNKYRAKDPFKCKTFIEFIKKINYTEADYLILQVD